MFVTASDFNVVPYNIPNLDKVADTFSDYVETKEEEALLRLLGRQLYTAFVDGLAALTQYTWSASVATVIGREYRYGNSIWEALTVQTGTAPVEGSDWTLVEADNIWLKLKNGADYEYGGLTHVWEGMTVLLKPFIFSEWVKDNHQPLTGIGTVSPNAENAIPVNPGRIIAKSWNDFAGKAGSNYDSIDTLYGFLVANIADYEDWTFCDPGFKNVFNL